MKTLAMTIHDRPPQVLRSVLSSLAFPGNAVDRVAVCYDRAPKRTIGAVRHQCGMMDIPLREIFLDDDVDGFRCPSKAWNAVFNIIGDDHAFCISSDCVLGPHSIGMAYHLSKSFPDAIIVGKAEHCGPSYYSKFQMRGDQNVIVCRTYTSSIFFHPFGFAWLLPMKQVREIGGYDTAFMDGFCYEDNDFTIRMWDAGAEIIFCDDILALHVEHPREHVNNIEKVERNRKIFLDRYGEDDYLDNAEKMGAHFWQSQANGIPGLAAWVRDPDLNIIKTLVVQQRRYGHGEDWVAIPEDEMTWNWGENETGPDAP